MIECTRMPNNYILPELYIAKAEAEQNGDIKLISILDAEIERRSPAYSSLQNEPWDLEYEWEDRRKEVMENKAEPEDYLPF